MSYGPSSSLLDDSLTFDSSQLETLVRGNLIPLHVCLVGLTWILHDYFITVEDETRYIWPQRFNFSKFMFFWIRYYTIALLFFDVVQIHVFARPGITSNDLCVAMDTVIRVVGAVSLWSVELTMQLRVYALYDRSKRILALTSTLFLASIAGFFYILVFNHDHRAAVIADAIKLPLPGCPTVHSGIEWAQWVPATAFEGVLCVLAVGKMCGETLVMLKKDRTLPLHTILLRDSLAWFVGISALLVFNNLMVVNVTHIPWFSYAPFHAAMGIMTSRMLISLRKAQAVNSSSPSLDLVVSAGVGVWAGEDSQTPLTPAGGAGSGFWPERMVAAPAAARRSEPV